MFSRYPAFRGAAARSRLPPCVSVRGVLQRGRSIHSTSASHTSFRRVRLGTLALTGALSSSAYLFLNQPLQPSPSDIDERLDDAIHDHKSHQRQLPLASLIRTYIVYSMCSMPWLVDYSPTILSVLTSVPGLKQVTEAIVRATFFSQFVGGESAEDTVPVLTQLRAENKGAILNYSAEVDESEVTRNSGAKYPVQKQIVEEILRCIDVAADFEDQREAQLGRRSGLRTWVAVKLTALVPDANVFIRFSKYLMNTRPQSTQPIPFPGVARPTDLRIVNTIPVDLLMTFPLTREDITSLRELKGDLFRVCRRAKERGVTIIIDAEHSWYQPAIEAFQLALMREFNQLPERASSGREGSPIQPLVYGTFQAYLRRTLEQLEQSLRDAEEGNYALGVKLVRGAYHQLETSLHNQLRDHDKASSTSTPSSISTDKVPPVWQTKAETDACFNTCARMLIRRVADDVKSEKRRQGDVSRLGLLFGTHNAGSCELVLDALVEEGLAVRMLEVGGKGKDVKDVIRISEEASRRVTVGQLYGMSDALSSSLSDRVRSASSEPFVLKYLPYGALSQVMPYLGRRAIENKSVLGGGAAREERVRIGREILARIRKLFALD